MKQYQIRTLMQPLIIDADRCSTMQSWLIQNTRRHFSPSTKKVSSMSSRHRRSMAEHYNSEENDTVLIGKISRARRFWVVTVEGRSDWKIYRVVKSVEIDPLLSSQILFWTVFIQVATFTSTYFIYFLLY